MNNGDVIVCWWLESLPCSERPLLYLGTGYGYHTAAVVRHSRDVIHVDEEIGYVDLLRLRLQKMLDTGLDEKNSFHGRLIDAKAVRLRNKNAFLKRSATGILLCKWCIF